MEIIGSPDYISYNSTQTIISQMEKCIAEIKVEGVQGTTEQATAFFCKIPFPDENGGYTGLTKDVLITNNHIINRELLNKPDSTISFLKYGDPDTTKIKLKNDRMKYTNEEYDITIIELKQRDRIQNFLELDQILIDDIESRSANLNLQFGNETIYIIQYPNGNLSVSFGVLTQIEELKKINFIHSCRTAYGSSGSPILNSQNKVIGIHKGRSNNRNINYGSFLNNAIKEFIKENSKTENEKALDKFNEEYINKIKAPLSLENDSLNFSHNYIKDKGFNKLNNIEFKKVKNLNLEFNNITNIESLTRNKSKNLKILNLSDNSITDIEPLTKVDFPRLEVLNLSSNKISNIGSIEKFNFNKLQILDLGHNKKIKYINSLDKPLFGKLIELNLEDNIIEDVDSLETAEFEKLKILNLSKNKIQKIDAFEKAKFRGLNTLNLDKNEIKDISILSRTSFEKELTNLNVSNNHIKTIGIFAVHKFGKLKTLYTYGNKDIDDSEIKKLKEYIEQNYKLEHYTLK